MIFCFYPMTKKEKLVSEVRIGEKKRLMELERERLGAMKHLGVDISKVFVAECRLPDKTIRVENAATSSAPSLHLHENTTRRTPLKSEVCGGPYK